MGDGGGHFWARCRLDFGFCVVFGKSLGAILCGCAEVHRLSSLLHVLFGYFLRHSPPDNFPVKLIAKSIGRWNHDKRAEIVRRII